MWGHLANSGSGRSLKQLIPEETNCSNLFLKGYFDELDFMTSTGVEQPCVMLLQPGPMWVSRCAVLPLQSYLISVSDSTKLFSQFSVLLVLCVSSGKLQIFAQENKICYIAVSIWALGVRGWVWHFMKHCYVYFDCLKKYLKILHDWRFHARLYIRFILILLQSDRYYIKILRHQTSRPLNCNEWNLKSLDPESQGLLQHQSLMPCLDRSLHSSS